MQVKEATEAATLQKSTIHLQNKLENGAIDIFVENRVDVEVLCSLQAVMFIHIGADPQAKFRNQLDDSNER
jgi:hypothetical protein